MTGSWGTGHWEALSTAPARGDHQDQVVSPGDRHRDDGEVGEGTGKPGLRSYAAPPRKSQCSRETRLETVETLGSHVESCLSFSKALFFRVPAGLFCFAQYTFSVMLLLKIT